MLGYHDIEAIDRMEIWLVASLLGVDRPEPDQPGRVSREEWPDLPDDYESLPQVVKRAIYMQGRGPNPADDFEPVG